MQALLPEAKPFISLICIFILFSDINEAHAQYTVGEGKACSDFAGVGCAAGLICDYSQGMTGYCVSRFINSRFHLRKEGSIFSL